jgi:hypothetical protein
MAEEVRPSEVPKPQGVQWKSLMNQSFRFLMIENAFRYATEAGTRDPDVPFFQGYADAVGALHGWADGDPFYVNYVGHPMQGAVSGYLWSLNDTRYRYVEFGRNPDYWKSRLRAGAFAWAYSEQTEIGPVLSEAAIGNIQAFYPQQGFVDHVVTPAIGLGWMIAEDVMDRYLVRFVERKTHNRYVRILVRGGANPSRSFANVIAGQWPWARPRDHAPAALAEQTHTNTRSSQVQDSGVPLGVAPFEFFANAYGVMGPGGTCAGGGASAAFRVGSQFQIVMDVDGCKLAGLTKNLTGDSLIYMAGPRWTPPVPGRLVPYAQVLFGGNKVTQELMFPQEKALLYEQTPADAPLPKHDSYTRQFESDSFAMSAGAGLDLNVNRALGLRLIAVEYLHTWVSDLNGFPPPHGIQLKMGLLVHMGNW